MRVIAGTQKGRKLLTPDGSQVRPSSDRLRTVLFDILGHSIKNITMLDLFAGSGGVGIEALSRGAKWVDFVEINNKIARSIDANLQRTHLEDHSRVVVADAFVFLSRLNGFKNRYDLIFADPPYNYEMHNELIALVDKEKALADEGMLVFEVSSRNKRLEESSRLKIVRERKIGESSLLFFQKK